MLTEPDYTLPTRHINTLKRWSVRWDWQVRVIEYERRAAEQREQERQRLRIEIESRAIDDGLNMLKWWQDRQMQYHTSSEAVPTMSYRELVKMRKEIDDLIRRSAGLPDRVTESTNTIKGTGDDGAVLIEERYTDDQRVRGLGALFDALRANHIARDSGGPNVVDASEHATVDGPAEPSG